MKTVPWVTVMRLSSYNLFSNYGLFSVMHTLMPWQWPNGNFLFNIISRRNSIIYCFDSVIMSMKCFVWECTDENYRKMLLYQGTIFF